MYDCEEREIASGNTSELRTVQLVEVQNERCRRWRLLQHTFVDFQPLHTPSADWRGVIFLHGVKSIRGFPHLLGGMGVSWDERALADDLVIPTFPRRICPKNYSSLISLFIGGPSTSIVMTRATCSECNQVSGHAIGWTFPSRAGGLPTRFNIPDLWWRF